ncbi:MAG: copper chaperone PCu(A)C [Betaproteobacteria bacterium]|nr:copper chaperone PCu(A)C [Betaproteobacteria bacterium]
MKIRFALAVAASLAAFPAAAQVTVSDPWVRSTVPAQKATGAFMKVKSDSEAKLVSAASPVAKVVEVHEMSMKDNVMQMRAVDSLALPAGKTVELKPGGYHVMLMDLVKPIDKGAAVPITLTFVGKDGKKFTQEVKAEARAPGDDGSKHKGHKH